MKKYESYEEYSLRLNSLSIELLKLLYRRDGWVRSLPLKMTHNKGKILEDSCGTKYQLLTLVRDKRAHNLLMFCVLEH